MNYHVNHDIALDIGVSQMLKIFSDNHCALSMYIYTVYIFFFFERVNHFKWTSLS
jgi:hypothetical protein